MTDDEHHMTDDEHHITDDERHMTDDELHMTDDERYMTDDERHMTDDEHHMTDDERHMTDDEIHVTDDEHYMTDDERHMTDYELHMTDEELHMTDDEHYMTDDEHHMTDDEHHMTDDDCEHHMTDDEDDEDDEPHMIDDDFEDHMTDKDGHNNYLCAHATGTLVYFENIWRTVGKPYLTFFLLVVFPAGFFVLSLIVAVVAMAAGEQQGAAVSESKQREEEFSQILEAIKRSEEEETASRAALSQEPEEEKKDSMEGLEEVQRSCPACCSVTSKVLLKRNCCGCWRGLKQRLQALVRDPLFDLGVVLCLVINTIFMSLEHFPMTEQFSSMLNDVELVFTVIFIVEMLLKLVAFAPNGYFQQLSGSGETSCLSAAQVRLPVCQWLSGSGETSCLSAAQVSWNIYDSIIVFVSLLLLADIIELRFSYWWWPMLHMLMKIIWTALSSLRNLTLLLFITLFIFSVAGLQLFGKDYKECVCRIAEDCELPRFHMTDFFHSLMVVLRVLFGDWVEALWDCMEVSGPTSCLLFFMVLLVSGHLLALNLFLVLLLSPLRGLSPAGPEEKVNNNVQMALKRIYRAAGSLLGRKTGAKPELTERDGQEVDRKEHLALHIRTNGDHEVPEETPEQKSKTPEGHQHGDPEDCCSQKCCPLQVVDSSRGAGRVWTNFRRFCLCIVQHNLFEIFIIFIIVLSSMALAFEDVHLHQWPLLKEVLHRADQLFTLLFLSEMLLKWSAFGLSKYFRDGWCCLDFLVLHVFLVSLGTEIFGFDSLGFLMFLRSLRALGPLRILSHFQGLRVVVLSLLGGAPALLLVLLVVLLVLQVFSLLGVNLFAGKFSFCFNETSGEVFPASEVNNQTECMFLMYENYSVQWRNHELNYDNVLRGHLSLLHLPVYEAQPRAYLYYVLFIIISSFFTCNLFIRVFINHLQRHEIWKQLFSTEQQQRWIESLKNRVLRPARPVPRPQNCLQARLLDLVSSVWFEVLVVVVICLHLVSLMSERELMSGGTAELLHFLYLVVLVLYLLEFILKVTALRKHYFTNALNVLDFLVLILSIAGLLIADFFIVYFFSPSIILMLRVTRVLRVLCWDPSIRKLLLSFMMSLPALLNLGLVFLLLIFTSSIFGMLSFPFVRKQGMMDDMFNFETFGSSLICVLMISSSASWGGLLSPLMKTSPDCDPDTLNPGSFIRGDCGSPALAIVFFIVNIYLGYLLVVNMYIAVILEVFGPEENQTLSDQHLQNFCKTWMKFDPESSQFIKYSELSDFCDALQDPLRIPKPNSLRLTSMDLPLQAGDQMLCQDVLLALAAQVTLLLLLLLLGSETRCSARTSCWPSQVCAESTSSLRARLEEKFPSKVSCGPISSTLQRKQEEVAAAVIQRAFRKHAAAKP
ncbi:Sodium channel protein type 4 subunit alpha B [Dissostichus eleginoides]|uniref:Sodium channel protein type 4 subunit alpha B n=1 Tax=Dissostichus eleginoides TaxID=100907 RepID=A0AAD9EW13_DISEL|nr:Sodium channel protein type 4 subunit alpha B [Dissostichus eleginoides]